MFAHASEMFLVRDFHTSEKGNVYKCLPISNQSQISQVQFLEFRPKKCFWRKVYSDAVRKDFRARMVQFGHQGEFPRTEKGLTGKAEPLGNGQ